VVVLDELFFPFFPPLWLFFVLLVVLVVVVFLPGGSGCGFNELLSPPVCAMTSPAPRSNLITNVETFFIQFLRIRFLLWALAHVNPGPG
jgi:hypothetical protein